MYSTAHNTSHWCASFCFGVQNSVPKQKKSCTIQQTATMCVCVWTGHQLHKFRKVVKLINPRCGMLAWRNVAGRIALERVQKAMRERFLRRGMEACALLTMRIERSALEKLVCEANDAAAEGDMGRVFAVTKKLKSGHDRARKVIRDENGVLWTKNRSSPSGGVDRVVGASQGV